MALWVGCEKRPNSASNSLPPDSVPAQTDGTAVATDPAQRAILLTELTQAVRKFAAEERRVPNGLEEVVAKGYLNNIPPAPPGKKFAINKSLQVYLANP
jgi:hypothetical protein